MLPEITARLYLEEVTETAALEFLEPEWNELWLDSTTATPFQSPAWLVPWWRHFGGSGLWTLVVRCHGRLVGIAPLFIYHSPHFRRRKVLLIGTGISDYLDILARNGFEMRVASLVLAHLQERQDRWDLCDFQELPAGSFLLQTGIKCANRAEAQSICPFLSLPQDLEKIEEVIPPSMCERISYYRRRAAKSGPLAFGYAEDTTLDQLFDAFIDLHAALWRSRGSPGMLCDPVIQSFHRDAARKFLSCGALRLYTMHIKGEVVGSLYAFASAKRVCFYLSGFDPRYAQVSPGTLLIAHGIEEALRDGATEFDFLRGNENYKAAWGATNRHNYRRWIVAHDELTTIKDWGLDPIEVHVPVHDR